MDRLNFNHLFYFYVVAKEGSVKAAAEKLHVSQPTISDQIKLLEEYFNCQLFERKNRSLILNDQGVQALRYAEKIFDLSNEATSRLRNKIQLPKRSLDIGVTQYMSQYLIYENLLPFFEHGEVSIHIRERERHYLLADLEEGEIDMVITDNKDSISSTMEAYRMGVNRTFAVGHKKFRRFKENFPEGLSEVPFFNYTNDSSLKFEIELFFSKHSVAPKIIGEADDIDIHHLITERGLAFTIVPEVAKKRFCTNKDMIVLGELTDFQSSVWGIIKNNYRGLGHQFLTGKL